MTNNYTHHTAPTQFVEAGSIRFAYRRFGAKLDIPLVGSGWCTAKVADRLIGKSE